MPAASTPTLAVSSWSVHRALGIRHPDSPARAWAGEAEPAWGTGEVTLLELPARIAALGIDRLQICHFHLAGRDPACLGELRAALGEAGVTLSTLLIDDGDITHPTERRRDIAWIGGWIDAAAILGAENVRVIAGKQQPAPETLALSVEGLRSLGRHGAASGVRVLTENWFALLSGPREVDHVLDRLEGEVGFLADFGNWTGAGKYADLAAVLGRAEETHAKAHFDDGGNLDGGDFGRCLEAAIAAGYDGPYTLVYEGAADDEWAAVKVERDFVRDHFARLAA